MARKKTLLQIKLEYYPIRGLFEILRRLPLDWGTALCRVLMALLFIFLPKRRKIVHDNLAFCFPKLSPPLRRSIARDSLRNLARGVAQTSRLPDLFKADVTGWLVPEGFHHAKEALSKGKGVIFFTAHYGCWEAMTHSFQRYCGPFSPVARPLDNPLLEKLITSVRTSNGAHVIHQHQVLKQGLRCLRRNEILGFLIDQNFYKGGLFVDFFGRPAATTPIVSLLARRVGSPVLPVHSVWQSNQLRVIMEPPVRLSSHSDPQTAIAEDTQSMARIMEGWIRAEPAQWLWLHNRWKRRPEPGDWIYSTASHVNNVRGPA